MPSLKDLRLRIVSVKSTRKITSAMKMVAASKLRRAQTAAESARPFAERMERMLGTLAGSLAGQSGAPRMLAGTGKDDVQLIVMVTADRGLCGGFNSSIVRNVKQLAGQLLKEGKTVKILPVGRKGREQIRRDFGPHLIEGFEGLGRKGISFAEADQVATRITQLFDENEFDVCTVVYNRFQSAIAQVVTRQQLIPFPVPAEGPVKADAAAKALYEFEPSEEDILNSLLPRNLAVQIFRSILESQASEQGARMTAMDNATRNAGDMINGLTIKYNRSRQAQITKELIEIISGAEAL
ncbi:MULTISPECIES: F0F1 ATP synthase subunit gamma [Magnetospirillum]|uniref:ATP synthase gamma chain n=1 Tax=Magnetospirillum moscoviense TaxID=1437059 RepID=A0A178MUP2_9PROT|nr:MULTISPECIES: F0F1 ATP synthase subunit gamma [Magnetospirillum]MBF0325279.1 F0F1 ATP synthase subunit gamma [Alphaproteobacteria bacterium]OAN54003.1 F0F1 ATP synthase subunit gamma [Magnetospirillum moscoviense]